MCNYDGMRNRLYDHNNLAMSSLLIDTHKHPLLLKWRAKKYEGEAIFNVVCVLCVICVCQCFLGSRGQTDQVLSTSEFSENSPYLISMT